MKKVKNQLIEENISQHKTLVWCLFAFLAIVTLVFRLMHLDVLKHLIVINDEVMYWAHAANMSGLEWDRITHAWYTYGYSFILLPLFKMFHDVSSIYRAAIILNASMAVISFFVSVLIIKEIFEEKVNMYFAIIISFLIVNFSSYQLQSQIAWSETTQYTLFLLIIYAGIKLMKKPSCIKTLIFSFLVMYLYITHNKNLGNIIAMYIVFVVMLFKKQIKVQHVLTAVIVTIAFFLLDKNMRVFLNEKMWGEKIIKQALATGKEVVKKATYVKDDIKQVVKTATANQFYGNDVNSIFSKINLASPEFWLNAFVSLCNKIWANVTSTFLLSLWGVMYCFKTVFEGIKKKEWGAKQNIILFILLATMILFAVVSIFMMQYKPTSATVENRVDYYLYTRYTDVLTGILIVLGICYMLERINEKRFYIPVIIASVIYIITLMVGYLYFSYIESGRFNVINVPSILFFPSFSMRHYTLFVLFVHAIICILAMIIKKHKQAVILFLFTAVSLTFYTISANTAYENYIKVAQQDQLRFDEGAEILNRYKEYPIVLFKEQESSTVGAYLRTTLMDRKIVHDVSELRTDNYFAITSDYNIEAKDYPADPLFIWNTDDFSIAAIGKELQDKIEVSGDYIVDKDVPVRKLLDVSINPNGNVELYEGGFRIRKDGTSYMTFGEIPQGVYELGFYAEGEIEDNDKYTISQDLGNKVLVDCKLKKGWNKTKFAITEESWNSEAIIKNLHDGVIDINRIYLKQYEEGWAAANEFNNSVGGDV